MVVSSVSVDEPEADTLEAFEVEYEYAGARTEEVDDEAGAGEVTTVRVLDVVDEGYDGAVDSGAVGVVGVVGVIGVIVVVGVVGVAVA